ncbi:MAG: hydroxylamine oxidase [Spirochaetes bacterium]|nr:hydroxylamine oxidase [Spirochaetota bacterium]
MKKIFLVLIFQGMILMPLYAEQSPISGDTRTCIDCHSSLHPGIVKDWENGLHSKNSFNSAKLKDQLSRRVSSENVPDNLSSSAVGCAECHTMNPEKHKDTFEHNGFNVHIVVTPQDCAVCHGEEVKQYGKNTMSEAYANLVNNPLYMDLADSINGIQFFSNDIIKLNKSDELTGDSACLDCHGTDVKVTGSVKKTTEMGELAFPVLSGWPNQGVGRINPDGSKGSCASCHTRHSFSSEIARKPYTCAECHKGMDVPAYKVYSVSKHGNIFSSEEKKWDFKAYPWTIGKDFIAPTCAACHMSLVVNTDGKTLAERTHQVSDRLSWRIFGLIYAHPNPKSPDTSIIRNSAGLPLPTELTGEPAAKYLIDSAEQGRRRAVMKNICSGCHSGQWVDGHFNRYENAIKTTNEMTLTSTKILLSAWENGAARGPADKDSIFNEYIEKLWVEGWLFFANSVRFSAAMAGSDYGVFENGRWYLSKNIQAMYDLLNLKKTKKAGIAGKAEKPQVKAPVKK